jgi:hypothetical protein
MATSDCGLALYHEMLLRTMADLVNAPSAPGGSVVYCAPGRSAAFCLEGT